MLCAAVAVFMVCSLAEGKEKAGALSAEDFVPADTVAVSDIIEGLTARSAVVTEMTTGRVLFEKEPQEQCECGHYAKLMVLLLTAEKIDSGELSMSDTSVVSEYANTQPLIMLKPSLVDEKQGSTVTISENLDVSNEFHINSTMARADGYNYVNIGQKLSTSNHMDVGSSGFDVDLFCCEANIGGNDYTQYGNFYVYKGAGAYNGDATFGAAGQTINGSLYVEGDLNVTKSLKVTGSVYVTGTITGKDKIVCQASNIHEGAVLSKAGRDAKPQIPVSADAYVYYPEDFFMSSDTNVTTISDQYQAFYDGSNTKTFNTFASDPSYWNNVDYTLTEPIDLTGTGAKTPVTSRYKLRITSSCTWASR